MNRLGKITVMAMATLIWSSAAMGAPIVDIANDGQPLVDGATVIIQGTGFSSKTNGQPMVWQDFEDGSNGAELSSTGFWRISSDNATGLRPKFDNGSSRDGGGLNALLTYPPSSQRDIIFRQDLDIRPGEKVFVSVWIRSSFAGPDNPSAKQWKLMRLSEGPYNSDTYPDLYFDWNRNGFYAAFRDGSGDIRTSCMTSPSQTDYMSPPSPNTWFNFMIQARMESGVGACDGYAKIWYNGRLEMDFDHAKALTDETDSGWDEIWLGEYVQENTVTYTSRFDDVYIDDSWARVEIGNNSSYGSCTHREIQVPVSWNESNISLEVNQGSLPSNTDLFLFVVDESGNASGGHPIRFGGGTPDLIPPTISIAETDTFAVEIDGFPHFLGVSGEADDNRSVTSVTWENSLGGSGTASGTTSWEVDSLELYEGINAIVFRAHDSGGNTNSVLLEIEWGYPKYVTQPVLNE